MGIQFTQDMIDLINADRKTQTRRPVKPGDALLRPVYSGVEVMRNGRRQWVAGRSYSIQPGRGKTAVGSLVITAIRREKVSDISPADARAEGFADREAFFAKWRALYGEDADLSADVWVIEFKPWRAGQS